jgi:hypothetical protein
MPIEPNEEKKQLRIEERKQLRNAIERHRKSPEYDQIMTSMFPGGLTAMMNILDLDPSTPEQIRQIPKDKLTIEQTAKIRAFYRIRYAITLLDSGENERRGAEREARRRAAQNEETPNESPPHDGEPDWENVDQLNAEEAVRVEEIAKTRLEAELA